MSQPTQPGQDVPDELLTAALGGYYGHPTAITAADPDVIDGLTAGLAAGMASFDQRLRDVQDEYARAGASWDTTRDRLNGEIARLTEERDAAREANGRYAAAGARWQQRAEQAEVKLASTKRLLDNRVQDCVDLTQRAETAEAERDQLRAAVERVKAAIRPLAEQKIPIVGVSVILEALTQPIDLAALDQAPAAEQDGGER
jgi:cell division protein FtsB